MKIPAIRPLNFNKNSRSILKIEFDCYTDPWDEETFRDCFKQKHTRGLTVDLDGEIVGFIIYQINKNSITLVNVAVDKAHRRKGYAKELVNSVKKSFEEKGRSNWTPLCLTFVSNLICS
jgi:ribosomal-protein-alanine N-acetyltransferase